MPEARKMAPVRIMPIAMTAPRPIGRFGPVAASVTFRLAAVCALTPGGPPWSVGGVAGEVAGGPALDGGAGVVAPTV
jgi:hypothetical protein